MSLVVEKGLAKSLSQEGQVFELSFAPGTQDTDKPISGRETGVEEIPEMKQTSSRKLSLSDPWETVPELLLAPGEGDFDGIATAFLNRQARESKAFSPFPYKDRMERKKRASTRGFASNLPPYKNSNTIFEDNRRNQFSRPLNSQDKHSKSYLSAYDPPTANHLKENKKSSFRG